MKAAYLVAAMGAAVPAATSAETLLLDFGTTSQSSFGTDGNLVMSYVSVSAGVNATLTAEQAFVSGNPALNGSTLGDMRVNLLMNSTAKLRLNLWDAGIGSGFDTSFDPGVPFDWTLAFMDIDGFPDFYDSVTLRSRADYTVTETSTLLIDNSVADQVTFSGQNAGSVPGQAGITVLTKEQADIVALFTVRNMSEVVFDYSNLGGRGDTLQRNLLIDGGDLAFALDPFNPRTNSNPPDDSAPLPGVPLPAGGVLLLAGLGILGAAGRMRRPHRA